MRKFFTITGMLIIIGVYAAVIYTGHQHNLKNEKAQALYDSAEGMLANAPEEMSYSQALNQYEKLYELIDKIETEYPQSNIAKDLRLKKAYPLLFLSNIKNSLKYLRYFKKAASNVADCLAFLEKMHRSGHKKMLELAQTFIDDSKPDAALPILQGMYKILKGRNASTIRKLMLQRLAKQFIELNQFETAFEIAELSNNTFLKASINTEILKDQLEQKQFAEAKQTETKTNSLQKAIKNPRKRLEILLALADIFDKAGKNDLRDSYLKLAEKIAEAIKDSVDQNGTLCNIAAHHAIFENHDRAEEIIEKLKPKEWDDTCLVKIIEKFIENQNFKQSLNYAEKLNRALLYIKIARAQAESGKSENAPQTLTIALERSASDHGTTRISNQIKIAEIYGVLGKRQKAEELLNSAIEATKEVRFHYKNRLFSAISETCIKLGLYENLAEAINKMEDEIIVKAYAVSALAAKHAEESKETARQEAIQAIKLAKDIKSFTKECEELQKISENWADQNLFKWAYQSAQTIRDPKTKTKSLKYLAQKCIEANKIKMARSILKKIDDSKQKEDFIFFLVKTLLKNENFDAADRILKKTTQKDTAQSLMHMIFQKKALENAKKEDFLRAGRIAEQIMDRRIKTETLFQILHEICKKELHTKPDSEKYLESVVQAAVPVGMFFNPDLRRRHKLSNRLKRWFGKNSS
ncbi:MAG: tetratricopeptide repeat protein [Candidatus Rifleibacteriota bacterium]